MSWNINKNTIKTYNHNDGDSSSNSKHPKPISFSINDKLGHFEQLAKVVMIILSVFDNVKIGNLLSTTFR